MFNFFCTECFQGGSQHNFEPRFIEHFANNNVGELKEYIEIISHPMDIVDMIDIMDQYRKMKIEQQYVYDICTWCGKIAQPAKETEKEQK